MSVFVFSTSVFFKLLQHAPDQTFLFKTSCEYLNECALIGGNQSHYDVRKRERERNKGNLYMLYLINVPLIESGINTQAEVT